MLTHLFDTNIKIIENYLSKFKNHKDITRKENYNL